MMAAPNIVAGEQGQIRSDSGDWLIVDIGMRMNRSTCGVWYSPGTLDKITFGALKELVIRKAKCCDKPPLNLLIEAPLSGAWQLNGNPGRRECDAWGEKHSDWHHGPGATTLLAAQFLLRELYECQTRQREVRLFEGHVSFKSAEDKRLEEKDETDSDKRDALALKKAVWHETRREIFEPDQLVEGSDLKIEAPFPFFDKNLVPPVIRVIPVR